MSRMSFKAGASRKAIRYAVAGVLAAGLLTGCASSGSKQLARAGDHAVRSEAKLGRAVDGAEQTVQKTPNDAAARVALAQAYLEAGRFQSAATTFSDAVQLGDATGRTQLSLALAQIGAGNPAAAVAVLDEARDTIPAADRGLALALAGDTGRGVAILLDAVRGGEGTPKLRQNLAYAYALDGRWREARLAMSQDVPPDQIDDRISSWAMMGRPEDVQRRVASLLAVPTGVADAGQPQALALGAAPKGEQFAAAPAAPVTGELPAIGEAPAAIAAAPAPVAAEPAPAKPSPEFATAFAAAPPPAYVAQPAAAPAKAAPARSLKSIGHAASLSVQPAFVAAADGGTHLVQLGSFSSEANAKRAVRFYTARHPELRNLNLTITPAVVRGKNFWRVAAGGLDNSSASRLCSGLRNRGNACFAYASNHAPAGVVRPAMAFAGTGTKVRR